MGKERRKRKIIICKNCLEEKEHDAQGYCKQCYYEVVRKNRIIICKRCGKEGKAYNDSICHPCFDKARWKRIKRTRTRRCNKCKDNFTADQLIKETGRKYLCKNCYRLTINELTRLYFDAGMGLIKISEISEKQLGFYLNHLTVRKILVSKYGTEKMRDQTQGIQAMWNNKDEVFRKERAQKMREINFQRMEKEPDSFENFFASRPAKRKKQQRVKDIEERFGEPVDQLFKRLYDQEEYSFGTIGEKVGMSGSSVANWYVDDFGFTARSVQEAMQIERHKEKMRNIICTQCAEKLKIGSKTLAWIKQNTNNPEFTAKLETQQIIDLINNYGLYELAGELETRRQNNDENVLIRQAKDGNELAFELLFDQYKKLFNFKAMGIFLPGAEKDDLQQEIHIGFFNAVKNFQFGMSTFTNFAALCIERQIGMVLRAATRQKKIPLNEYISLNQSVLGEEKEGGALAEILADTSKISDPEKTYMTHEKKIDLMRKLDNNITRFEKKSVLLYSQGYSREEIAEMLNSDFKSIKLAIARARRKLKGVDID